MTTNQTGHSQTIAIRLNRGEITPAEAERLLRQVGVPESQIQAILQAAANSTNQGPAAKTEATIPRSFSAGLGNQVVNPSQGFVAGDTINWQGQTATIQSYEWVPSNVREGGWWNLTARLPNGGQVHITNPTSNPNPDFTTKLGPLQFVEKISGATPSPTLTGSPTGSPLTLPGPGGSNSPGGFTPPDPNAFFLEPGGDRLAFNTTLENADLTRNQTSVLRSRTNEFLDRYNAALGNQVQQGQSPNTNPIDFFGGLNVRDEVLKLPPASRGVFSNTFAPNTRHLFSF